MARKTKKEKILAEYRRKLQSLNKPSLMPEPPPKKVSYEVNTPSQQVNLDYSYVLSDLRRITILSALAICAQVVLWYGLVVRR